VISNTCPFLSGGHVTEVDEMHRNGKRVVCRWSPTGKIAAGTLSCLLVVSLGAAAESTLSSEELAKEIERLEALVRSLAADRDEEIERLRARIAQLERELQEDGRDGERDELERLRAEAEEATADQSEREAAAEEQRQVFVGRQRNLQALNPEISVLGDISYDWTDTDVQDRFLLRGAEFSFQAPLDPYTRFKAYLAGHQEAAELEHEDEVPPQVGDGHEDEIEVAVEEIYVEWIALPLNTRLRVGKFRQQYGTLNRWHPHALSSVDLPFALRNVFGHEGLVGLGVGADWRLPGLWADGNGLTLEIVNADNDTAFAGSEFEDPSVLLRHTGFFDLGPDTYVEVGLNWVTGPNDEASNSDTTVSGLDFNFVWEPVQRAKYRGVEIRGEQVFSRFETADQGTVESSSFYLYASGKLNRRWVVGLRYDDAELPSPRVELHDDQAFGEGLRERAWSPFLTFWQSEYVRLRLQYQHVSRDFTWVHGPDDDDRVWLQVTFAAGPHKHETY
jgi:hypothetical protein